MESDLRNLVIGGVARHVLTAIAGFLVTTGALSASQSTQFVSMGCGIVLWAATVAWSWWQKNGHAQVLARLKRRTP